MPPESGAGLSLESLISFFKRPDLFIKIVFWTVFVVQSVLDAAGWLKRRIRQFFRKAGRRDLNFYVLNKKKTKEEIRLKLVGLEYDPVLLFENGLPGGMSVVEATPGDGKHLYGLASFQDDLLNKAISESLKNALEKAGISGFKTFEILVKGSAEKYYGLVITGRAGPRKQPGKSGLVIGLEFDPETWDGSDIFLLSDYKKTILTPRAMRVFRKAGMKNTGFQKVLDYRWYNSSL